MTTALFVTVSAGGNLPPMLGIAQRFAGRAVVLGHPAQRAATEAAGLEFRPFTTVRPYDPAVHRNAPQTIGALSALLTDPAIGRAVATAGVGRSLHRKTSIDALRRAIAALAGDGPHRAAAAALGARIRTLDPAGAAAAQLASERTE